MDERRAGAAGGDKFARGMSSYIAITWLLTALTDNRLSKPSFKSSPKSSSTSNPPLLTSNGVQTPGGMSKLSLSLTGSTWIPCSAPAYCNYRDLASEWHRSSTLQTILKTQIHGTASTLAATLYYSRGERTRLHYRRARN